MYNRKEMQVEIMQSCLNTVRYTHLNWFISSMTNNIKIGVLTIFTLNHDYPYYPIIRGV